MQKDLWGVIAHESFFLFQSFQNYLMVGLLLQEHPNDSDFLVILLLMNNYELMGETPVFIRSPAVDISRARMTAGFSCEIQYYTSYSIILLVF